MTGSTTDALQLVFQKLGELAQHYGPSAVDTATQVIRINAIDTLIGFPVWGGLAIGAGLFSRWCFRKSQDASFDGDLAFGIGCFLSALLTVGLVFASVVCLFDVWAWIGLFNPKLGLAHEIMSALTQKVAAA